MKPLRETTRHRRALLQQFARIGHAFSTPGRLAIVNSLAHSEKTVAQLARATAQSLATTSAHLKVLRGAGLVVAEKRGRQVFCRLAGDNVAELWLAFRAVGAELLPEARTVIRQYFAAPETLAALTPQELAAEIAHDRVTLIDLRPPDEFNAGHLPGAINLPYADFTGRSSPPPELPTHKPVYAYCRGPYCILAAAGTRQLRALGIPASHLSFSVPEWKAAQRSSAAPR